MRKHHSWENLTKVALLVVALLGGLLNPMGTKHVGAENVPAEIEEVARPARVQGLRAQTNPEGSITLHWNPVPDADYYAVYYLGQEGEQNSFRTVTHNTHFTELKPQRGFHFFRVFAVKDHPYQVGSRIFSEGPFPNYVYAYSIEALPAPETLLLYQSAKGFQLVWPQVPEADGYQVLRRASYETSFKEVAMVEDSLYLDQDLLQDAQYFYIVRPFRTFRDQRQLGAPSPYVFGQTDAWDDLLPKPQSEQPESLPPEVEAPEAGLPDFEAPDVGDESGGSDGELGEISGKPAPLPGRSDLSLVTHLQVNGQALNLETSAVELTGDSSEIRLSFDLPRPLFVGTSLTDVKATLRDQGTGVLLGECKLAGMTGRHTLRLKSSQVVSGTVLDLTLNFELTNFEPLSAGYGSAAQVASHVVSEMDKLNLDLLGRIEYAYAYVRYTTDYTHSNGNGWTAEGSLVDRMGDCWGFSKGFAAIMDQIGVPSLICYQNDLPADSLLSRNIPHHAWVYVQIDGSWYLVDPAQGTTSMVERTGDWAQEMLLPGNVSQYFYHHSQNFLKGGQASASDLELYPELAKLSPVDYGAPTRFDFP